MLNTIRRMIGDKEEQEERDESMFDDMVIYNRKNEIDKENDVMILEKIVATCMKIKERK